MRVEVVAIGTELLLGQIQDTNSAWIGEELALVGLDSHFQTKVGDNQYRIVEALTQALDRSDAVICCGGLGPTQDDLTRSAIAELMGVALETDEEMEERIISMFMGRTRRMPDNNLRQAQRPVGATFIAEQPGTAPGLVCPLQWPRDGADTVEKVIYAVPGVPWEMQEMMLGTVLSDLQRRAGIEAVIRSRTLRTWGESESGLAELLAERIYELDRAGNPTIAFLASGMEGLKVRITAKCATQAEADEMLAEEEERLRALLGPLVFGVDDDTMESVVLDMLRSHGLTLATAESVTGGMVGSRICDVPGASDVYLGGVVAYAPEVKQQSLGVPEGPVISEDAAKAMALGVRERLGADVALAATGVAGPDESEGQPPGTVCLAVVIGDPDDRGVVETMEVRLPGRRKQVREFTVITLLGLLRRRLVDWAG
ncbi:MAG: competence/damage-inducible protein A [Actinomycetia bacterium]|nr:competence/damage-inducible protein A [Actinomycetes bacterium]